MNEQLTLAFEYTALDSETRIVVQQRTTEIKALMRRAASDIIEIGQKLIEVKERLGHGNFSNWLAAEFEWSHMTAARFMQVAEFAKINTGVNFANIQAKALYLLAAPSTPETARIEALERAEAGETITHSVAKAIVNTARAESDTVRQQAPIPTMHVVSSIPDSKPTLPPYVPAYSTGSSMPASISPQPVPAPSIVATVPAYDTPVVIPPATPIQPRFVPTAKDYADPYGDDVPEAPELTKEDSTDELDSGYETVETVNVDPGVDVVIIPPSRFNAGMKSSATPEHYTPAHIIELAREAMGCIDTDPASCVAANEIVQATEWYGLNHPNDTMRDGLAREWHGRVWMNPPYGDVIGDWMHRLKHQYEARFAVEAIALIPARTDTAWFQDTVVGTTVCLVRGRLKFGSAENSAPFPSALVYFGENVERFAAVFGQIGMIWHNTDVNQGS